MKKYLYTPLLLFLLLTGCRSSILDDPSTSVGFAIPQASYVKLTLINSYNTVVGTLVDGPLSAGYYRYQYDASGLTEGVYTFSLEVKDANGNSLYTGTISQLVIK